MADAIRVLIVDDHAVVREGLRTFLELQDGIAVVGEAADGEEAVARRPRRCAPTWSLMDLVMPRLDGVGAMRELRAPAAGHARDRADELHRGRAPAARDPGRRGRLPAQERRARRARARGPRRARGRGAAGPGDRRAAGRSDCAAAGAPATRAAHRRASSEVLALIARGFSNKRIALELGIAEKTVKTHVGHVLAKLGVTDRTQAAVHAVRMGLAQVLGPIARWRPAPERS